MYPNPAHGHIEISSKLSGIISVKLFSPMGQCVYQLGVNAGDIVDLKGLAKGIYICELKQQNILVNRKLVVYWNICDLEYWMNVCGVSESVWCAEGFSWVYGEGDVD